MFKSTLKNEDDGASSFKSLFPPLNFETPHASFVQSEIGLLTFVIIAKTLKELNIANGAKMMLIGTKIQGSPSYC